MDDLEKYNLLLDRIKNFAAKNSICFEQIKKAVEIGLDICMETNYIKADRRIKKTKISPKNYLISPSDI